MQDHSEAIFPFKKDYGGLWRRLFALCIDAVLFTLIIWGPPFAVLVYGSGILLSKDAANTGMDFFIHYETVLGYLGNIGFCIMAAAFCVSRWQATPGMRTFSLYLESDSGEKVSFARAFYLQLIVFLFSQLCAAPMNIWDFLYDSDGFIEQTRYSEGIPFTWYGFTNKQMLIGSIISYALMLLLYFSWILSMALSKQKAGIHNLICKTRILEGWASYAGPYPKK